MGVKKKEMDPENIDRVRIFFRDGHNITVTADEIELNRMVDELVIYDKGYVRARFYTHQIAGYQILSYESKYKGLMPRGEDS